MALMFGPFTLLPAQRQLFENGQALAVGSRAFDLLVLLAERAGEVLSNAELLAGAWPNRVVEPGSLRVHIAALRKVLGEGHGGRRYIANVPLRGYCFVAAVRPAGAPLQPLPLPVPAVPMPMPVAPCKVPESLPQALTRLIGRAEAVAELCARLRQHRGVTLVGAGGIGKTTVALAVAREVAERGLDQNPAAPPAGSGWEVVFVELCALEAPQAVAAAVASALGLVLPAGGALAALVGFLRPRQRLLLVLDNCEHLVGAVAELAEQLLLHAPGLRLLATSREALRIRGEWVQRLPPLPLPPARASAAQTLASPAVQLFAERAAAVSGSFQLREEDAPAALELCRRLDGIPLAIELAAAVVDQFGLQGLAEQLGGHLSVLSRGRRTALPRHRTLRAALDWSHALLLPAEQALLQRLALFRGAFTRAAAVALCDEPAALDEALAGLVDKSMLVADIGGERVLYRLLETTRAYVAERPVPEAQRLALAARHAAWLLALLRQGEGADGAPPAADWLAAHARHIDDLRAAVGWAFEPQGDAGLGIALVARSAPLWFALSLMDEYRQLAAQALAAVAQRSPSDADELMRLFEAHGHALWHTRGGGAATAASFQRALALAEQLGARAHQLRCMWGLWLICNTTGDYAGSAAYAERFGAALGGSADVAALLTHERMQAVSLYLAGAPARAAWHAERVLAHPHTHNHLAGHSGFQFDQRVAALTVLAVVCWLRGQPQRAQALAAEAVAAALALDHSLSLCYTVAYGAAPVAFWVGDEDRARRVVALLRQRADERSLHFWQAYAGGYELLLDLAALGEQVPRRDALQHPGAGLLLREKLATVAPCLFDAELCARAEAGHSGWCLPEMLRLQALQRGREGAAAPDVRAGLERAAAVAAAQGALSWQLRCAISLAQLALDGGEPERAAAGLSDVLSRFDEGGATADHRTARELLRRAGRPADRH